MLPEILALAAAAVLALAEWRHARRVRHLAPLAFGPRGRAARWTTLAPPLRVAAGTALAWALTSLALIRDFPLTAALVDLAWGAVLSAVVAGVVHLTA